MMFNFRDTSHRQMGQHVLSSNDATDVTCAQPNTKRILYQALWSKCRLALHNEAEL
jgi:hypothetical protein